MAILNRFFFILIILFICSCSNNQTDNSQPIDKENPTMSISSPQNGVIMPKGASILIDGIFTDDVELKELSVSLSISTTKFSVGINDPWQPEEVILPLTGKKQILEGFDIFQESIPVDCLSGMYVLTLNLLDAQGKNTKELIELKI